MIDERSMAIIHEILCYTSVSLAEIGNKLNLTKRQLFYSIDKINYFLEKSGIQKIEIDNSIIYLSDQTKKYILDNIESMGANKNEYIYSSSERKYIIYLILFCLENDYVSLDYLKDFLSVSKPTVISDLHGLNIDLKAYGIRVVYSREKGYYLFGDDDSIRYLMMHIIISTIENKGNAFLLSTLSKFSFPDYDSTYALAVRLMKETNIKFVEMRLDEFVFIFIFMIKHSKGNEIVFTEKYASTVKQLKSTKEYHFAKQLLKELNYKSEESALYLASWIIGLSVGDYYEYTPDRMIINNILRNMLIRFDSVSGMTISNSINLRIQMYQHLRPVYYRLLFHLPIVNPLKDKIKTEYSSIYEIVNETMKPFKDIFGNEIPDDEIAYITMHFAAETMDIKKSSEKKHVAIIVCPNGIGTSNILYKELCTLLPELNFLKPVEMSDVKNIKKAYDIVFSTKLNVELYDLEVPYIIVNPILSENEKNRIVREVSFALDDYMTPRIDINKLIEIIKLSADIKNYKTLERDLIYYLNQNELYIKEKGGGPLLSKIINENLIQLNVNAIDWEDAIRKSAQPLLTQKKVSTRYVDEMIENAKELGAYIVITKHVALPHARPEKGINKLAISITTLNNPIKFGNKENDPVKYVFCLSSEDNASHLNAMAELVRLLEKKEFFKVLDNSESSKQIYDYICNFEKMQ